MKKGIILMLLLSITLIFGCGQAEKTTEIGAKMNSIETDEKEQIPLLVAVPKSPAAIPVLRMIESNALGDQIKIDFKLYGDMDKMMAIAVGRDYGLMVVPVHTAAALYNKGIGVKLLNVFGWGGMYLSTTDLNCNGWEDLKGKQLYVPAKGSVPDIITQHFFSQHGLKIGDNIEVVYSSHPEIAQLIKAEKIKYAVDAEPYVTRNMETIQDYRIVSDFSDEWKKTEGSEYSLPANGIIVNSGFLAENKEVISIFNEEFKKALTWTLDNPAEAGVLAEKYLNADAKLIEKAMPGFNFIYKASINAKKDIEEYCNVLSSFKPESIGGKVPDENFYYKNE